MEWQMVITLTVIIPVILFLTALVWFINVGGIVAAVRDAIATKAVTVKATN